VYIIEIKYKIQRGLEIVTMFSDTTLVKKVLHHWDNIVTYKMLSVSQIKASLECADTLNSFNENLVPKKIDDLVNDAIQIELPSGCKCDCCQLMLDMK